MDFYVNTGYKTGIPGMSKVFFAPLSQITAMPEAPATGTTVGETAIATGSWTFKTLAGYDPNGFVDLCNDLLEGAQIDFSYEGDAASPSPKTKVMCRVIGWDPEIIERVNTMAGQPMVFIVQPDCNSTAYWIVGCECGAAYAKVKGSTDKKGGTAGVRFEFEIEANCKPVKSTVSFPLLTVD